MTPCPSSINAGTDRIGAGSYHLRGADPAFRLDSCTCNRTIRPINSTTSPPPPHHLNRHGAKDTKVAKGGGKLYLFPPSRSLRSWRLCGSPRFHSPATPHKSRTKPASTFAVGTSELR